MSETLAIASAGNELSLGASGFDHIQRVARMFSESQLVPTTFQKNLQNVVVALEMSQRIGCSPLMVMQNLNIIHGKPSFGASFMIATVNACGRFTPLRFVYVGERNSDEWGCYAIAKAKFDNAECRSVTITLGMAKAEGWVQKSGSKWKTMPELMMTYRAATWWTRMFAPELLMGFPTQDEVIDLDAKREDVDTKQEVPEPAAAETATRRRRSDKGISAMKQAEPVAEPTPPSADSSGSPAPAEPASSSALQPEPSSAPAVADTSKVQEDMKAREAKLAEANSGTPVKSAVTPGATQDAAPLPEARKEEGNASAVPPSAPSEADLAMLPRCELVSAADKGGGVTELQLKGDYTGVAYHQAASGTKVPAIGTVFDATFVDRPSKQRPGVVVKLVTNFDVVA